MSKAELCKQCGVPFMISKEMTWQNNGVISQISAQVGDLYYRNIFYEADCIDPVFRKVEETIGVPIDRIVSESKRRITREYLEKTIPLLSRRIIFAVGPKILAHRMAQMGKIIGLGDIQLVETHTRFSSLRDSFIMTIRKPYSIILFRGDVAAAMEAASGRDFTAVSEKIEEDTYRVVSKADKHPLELAERLKPRSYPLKPGNVQYERCTSCGIPLDVARYRWSLEEGTITDADAGRRMAFYPPTALEAIFDDLQYELGDAIPDAVIEAKRSYMEENVSSEDWLSSASTFGQMLATRGLGMPSRFEMDDHHITTTIQNPGVPYYLVGMTQGLFQSRTGNKNTTLDWDIAEDGDLTITVRNAGRGA